MDSQLRLIFFAHPRSGSSSLFQILQLHPALHLLEEPFNQHFTSWCPHNPNYREQIRDAASLDAQLAAIFTDYNGLKVLDYQLPDDLLTHLLHRSDTHVLFLRRRNLLQTVVSNLIAEQTQLWKKWDMTQPLEDYYRTLQFWLPDALECHLDLSVAARLMGNSLSRSLLRIPIMHLSSEGEREWG